MIPEVGAALSAAGALMSDLSAEYAHDELHHQRAVRDRDGQRRCWPSSTARCQAFIDGPGAGALEQTIEYAVEARYPHQIWEIEVPLRRRAGSPAPTTWPALVADFHAAHHELFAISDPGLRDRAR